MYFNDFKKDTISVMSTGVTFGVTYVEVCVILVDWILVANIFLYIH